jgi:cytoskeletal protein RodZ
MTEIGPTLRDARMRREIDLAEVERRTKIRVRYLRALENEEWDVLPGGPYTRSFIRTYASFLGLDGERLADDFRLERERLAEERPAKAEPPMRSSLPRGGEGGPRLGRGSVAILISVALVAVLVVLGLTSGNGNQSTTPAPLAKHKRHKAHHKQKQKKTAAGKAVSLKLTAIADVWVCLVDGKGTTLVNGQILPAGSDSGPFHSGKFDVRFGNGQVAVQVNGRQAPIAGSSSPVGYEVTSQGVRSLPQSQQPACA